MSVAATIGIFINAGALGFGVYRLWRQNVRQREYWTLQECQKYETNSELRKDVQKIVDKRNTVGDFSNMVEGEYETNVIMVLNWLDGIAIGVEQNLYDEQIVEDHLKPILKY